MVKNKMNLKSLSRFDSNGFEFHRSKVLVEGG